MLWINGLDLPDVLVDRRGMKYVGGASTPWDLGWRQKERPGNGPGLSARMDGANLDLETRFYATEGVAANTLLPPPHVHAGPQDGSQTWLEDNTRGHAPLI